SSRNTYARKSRSRICRRNELTWHLFQPEVLYVLYSRQTILHSLSTYPSLRQNHRPSHSRLLPMFSLLPIKQPDTSGFMSFPTNSPTQSSEKFLARLPPELRFTKDEPPPKDHLFSQCPHANDIFTTLKAGDSSMG